MGANGPSFQPFPWAALRRVSRREAAIESVIARWLGATRPAQGPRIASLLGRVAVRAMRIADGPHADPDAARAEVRVGGLAIELAASGRAIRALAQQLLGGPAELDAPRALTAVEVAVWCGAIAAALEDAGLAGEVWPASSSSAAAGATFVEIALDAAIGPLTVVAAIPAALALRAPAQPLRAWTLPVRVVVARATLAAAEIAALGVRDVVIVERGLALAVGGGTVGLSAAPGALEATVATGYVPRAMIVDDAQLELTVELGSTPLSLRQLTELAVGVIVPLGRPLGGPFELRAAGQRIGQGELVDIDGELGVRVLALNALNVQE